MEIEEKLFSCGLKNAASVFVEVWTTGQAYKQTEKNK